MPSTGSPSRVAELSEAVRASETDRAVRVALDGMGQGLSPLDLLRAAAVAAASRYDPEDPDPPWGLLAAPWAAELTSTLPVLGPLAVLQAIRLLAAGGESGSGELPPPPRILLGESTHLGPSFLFALRSRDLREAEAIFLGLLREGQEPRLAGDLLFRAAVEDPGDSGLKLRLATALWRFGRIMGFRDARTMLRPAIGFLVRGPSFPDSLRPIEAILGGLPVPLEDLGSGGRPLDDQGRRLLTSHLAAALPGDRIEGVLGLLRDGYSPRALSQGILLEAVRSLLAGEGPSPRALDALLLADASDFVVSFSRSGDRLYALFEAALHVRSPAVGPPSVDSGGSTEPSAVLRRLGQAIEDRRGEEAAALVGAYLLQGPSPSSLEEFLVRQVLLRSATESQGRTLCLAGLCTARFAITRLPEYPMALARAAAAFPLDGSLSEAGRAPVGP